MQSYILYSSNLKSDLESIYEWGVRNLVKLYACKTQFLTTSFLFLLSRSGISITADKISTILKAAGVSVEPYWPTLFAKALDGVDIGSLLGSLGSAASAVSAGKTCLLFVSTAT